MCPIASAIAMILVAQADGTEPRSHSLSQDYHEVVHQLKKDLSSAGRSTQTREDALNRAQRGYRALLERAESARDIELSADDYVALSETAARLKDRERSVSFAQMAVTRARDVEPYVALVRTLCAVGRPDDACRVIDQATHQFPAAEKLYLLHAFVALKYREIRSAEPAYHHTVRATDYVVQQVETHPFYVSYLARLVKDIREMAALVGRHGAPEDEFDRWRTRIHGRLKRHYSQVNEGDATRPVDQGDLMAVRLLSLGIVALDDIPNRADGETALYDWAEFLLSCKENAKLKDHWFIRLKRTWSRGVDRV